MVTEATSRIAQGDLKHRIPPTSADEVGLLAMSVNNMSKKISHLMASQIEKARFEKELETARMVQGTFFPKADIKLPNTSVTGFYQPASECGGDLWGHFTIEDGLEFVFIADAMGHGAPAALVTAMAYSTTMTIADIVKSESSFRDSPAKILDRLNRVIYEAVRGTISMTFFASILDTRNGTITYANAGHNFPVIMPLKGDDERLPKTAKASKGKGHQPISLKLMGTPLGIDPNATYSDKTSELRAGDKIFYFTDGLIECTSPKGEMIGRKTLLERIARDVNLGPEEMKHDIVNYAFEFFANQPLADDITVVVAEISKEWHANPAPVKPTVTRQVVQTSNELSKPQIPDPEPKQSKKFRLPSAS
jgi:serine phosphatase RsbU (regulator of sigma subunit)